MENEFGRVVDALPGLIWTALPDGRTDFLNQRWREYTGLGLEQAAGHAWQVAVHEEDRPALMEFWRSIVISGEPGEMEARLRRFDGAYRWFLFRASPLTDASGRIVKWCGMNTDIEDRKQAEAALLAHERRFGLIVDGLPAIVTIMTPQGELELVNRYAEDYFGSTLAQIQRSQTIGAFHPDDAAGVLTSWSEAVETGAPFDTEGRERRADGVYRWFHVRGLPLRDAEGAIVLWYLLHTDVDERRRAEALLAGEKALLEMMASGCALPVVLESLCRVFEEIADDCTCSVVLVDADGTHLRQGASPSLPESFTRSLDGRPIGPDTGPCAMASYLNRQVISADIQSEMRWRPYGWPQLALSYGLRAVWSTPIAARSGKVIGSFALHYRQPATPTVLHQTLIDRFTHLASLAIERDQGESALRRSEAFLAEAQRLSSTGSFHWELETGDITWSDQAYRIFGFDRSRPVTIDLIGSRVHPDDLPAMYDMIERARRGRDFEYEHRLCMPDQSTKYLHMVGHATTDADGRIEYVGAVRDVTERRLSEEALGRVRSELAHMARVSSLGALTASIAHEVNQPLSGIITNASTCMRMLAADPPNVEGARETARRTIRDGNRAADVIARLRALFSKQGAATEFVDLNEAAREVVALCSSDLNRNGAVVRMDLDEALPPVAADRVQLQQVILNLLTNAADAMSGVDDRPRRLSIRTEMGDGRVSLSVQDAGEGFDPGAATRLFDAFYTTKTSGMGIGLSVSRTIIENHHGRIWASSNDGPGATFSFSIPVAPPGGADAPAAGDAAYLARTF